MIQKVCVYCSSSSKVDSSYKEVAKQLGKLLAEKRYELVYGAGSVGLMGILADAVLDNGGKVTGVIPQFMVDVEWHHKGISTTILTDTMHERKEKMADLADAFVSLPGGVGTLEELLEIITWKQLGIHSKPIIIVNSNGYYNKLIEMMQHAADNLFIRPEHLGIWQVVETPEQIFNALLNNKEIHEDMRNFAKI